MPRGRNNTNKKKRETRKDRVERKDTEEQGENSREEDPSGIRAIADCLQQAAAELDSRVKNIHSLRDIQECVLTEETYFSILTCQVDNIRAEDRGEFKALIEKQRLLKKETDIVHTWYSIHHQARKLTSKASEQLERGFKPRPDIKVTFSKAFGQQIIIGLSERVPEFPFRCAQADAHFWQMIETYCCYPGCVQTEEGIPQGDFINSPGFYLHPKTRMIERHYIIHPALDLIENKRIHLNYFLEATLRAGKPPANTPYVHVPDHLLPDDHPNNSVPDY